MKRWIVLIFILSCLLVACSNGNTGQTGAATSGQQNMLVSTNVTYSAPTTPASSAVDSVQRPVIEGERLCQCGGNWL